MREILKVSLRMQEIQKLSLNAVENLFAHQRNKQKETGEEHAELGQDTLAHRAKGGGAGGAGGQEMHLNWHCQLRDRSGGDALWRST